VNFDTTPRAHLGEENNYRLCHYVHYLLKTIQMNQNQNIQSSFAKHSLEFSVKVRKTPHQYPEFGSKPGEIIKKTCKKVH
jgi:hypothetical protein